MSKLRLHLDSLNVESFAVEGDINERGTVAGYQTAMEPSCPQCTGEPTRAPEETCDQTCGGECLTPWCSLDCPTYLCSAMCPDATFSCPTAFC